jgi:hypothetical protein
MNPMNPIMRPFACLALAAALLALACGGGSSRGPTAPGPTPGPSVSLLGSWTGVMSIERSGSPTATCDLNLVFDMAQPPVFLGSFILTCPDGKHEEGIASATPFAGQVLLSSLSVPVASNPHPALDGCGWGGNLAQSGTRISGPWQGGGCQGSTIKGGQIDVRKNS